MSLNLVSYVLQALSPDHVDRMAKALGLERGAAARALLALAPALLSLMRGRIKSPAGAAHIVTSLAGMETGTAGRLAGMIGGADQGKAIDHGNTMVGHLLGSDGLNRLTRSITGHAGLGSAGSALVGLAAPTIIGSLSGLLREQKLDANTLSRMFDEQSDAIDGAFPLGFTWADESSAAHRPYSPASVTPSGASTMSVSAVSAATAAAAAAAAAALAANRPQSSPSAPRSTGPAAEAAARVTEAATRAAETTVVPAAAAASISTPRTPTASPLASVAPQRQQRAAFSGFGLLWLIPVAVLGAYGWWSLADRETRRIAGIRSEAVKLEAAAKARAEAEAKRKAEAEAAAAAAKARAEAEAKARADADAARVRAEAEARARAAAEAKSRADAEAARLKAELDANAAAVAKAAADSVAPPQATDGDAKARADAEAARLRAEQEAKERAEAEAARLRAEQLARARADSEAARLRAEQEAKARADAEAARQRAEQEAKARADAEAARQRAEQVARARADAEAARLRAEQEAQAKRLADIKACQDSVTTAAKSGPLRFGIASAVLSADSTATLDRLVTAIKSCPSTRLTVEGHTDSDGDADENKDLSQRRAAAVVDYLRQAGVDPARISAVGLGDSKPLVENDTRANKAINRRIEFVVAGQ